FLSRLKFTPTFNGGTDGPINSVYAFQNKIIATGDFRYYLSRRYNQPSSSLRDSTIIDSVDVRQLVRFNTDGSLDKTWRFDANAPGYKGIPGKSLPGGNGRLSSLMHTDGKLLAYGQFAKFDDTPKGYIVRLNADGTIDQSFNASGAGADNFIFHVSYNETTNKYIAVGIFKTFNGKPAINMVSLNYDGTVDESFVPKAFTGGRPSFAKQLNDGLIVVGGDFKAYDGVNKQGFLIVNAKGELAPGYNTTGNLLGFITDVNETKSADNKRALLIIGNFFVFDNKPASNIVRVTLE
ncbi:MAG: delta-60 repeat domain-containing protein, partial [Flavobacterium sp.]|nr:delta-60 repeat domain-containing protein [Pedobacter sp.]